MNNLKILVPSPIKQFLFDYNHSNFLECNSELSKMNAEKIKMNMEKLNKVSMKFKYLTKTLESMYKRYFLIAGTLLGIKTILCSVKYFLKIYKKFKDGIVIVV